LTKSITSPDNHGSQRRFAPIVIAEAAIVDRFQMKSMIVFLKIRTYPQVAKYNGPEALTTQRISFA
jgi:hypothetical protein